MPTSTKPEKRSILPLSVWLDTAGMNKSIVYERQTWVQCLPST